MYQRLSQAQVTCLRYAQDHGRVEVTPSGDDEDPFVFPVRTVVSLVRHGLLRVPGMGSEFHGYRITDEGKRALERYYGMGDSDDA